MTDEEQRQLTTPVCFGIASAILVALLVYYAVEIDAGHVSTDEHTSARVAAVRALAEMLGLVGSITVGSALVGAMILWSALSYRRIKRARRLVHA